MFFVPEARVNSSVSKKQIAGHFKEDIWNEEHEQCNVVI